MSFVSPTCSIHLDPTCFLIDGTAVCPPPTHQNDRNIAWPQLRNQSCAARSTNPVHNTCRGSHPSCWDYVDTAALYTAAYYTPLENLHKLHKPLNHQNSGLVTAKPPPGLRDPESRLGMVCLGHSSALKVLTPKSCCDVLCKPLLVWQSGVQQMKTHSWAPNKTAWWNNCWTVLTLLDVDCDWKKHPTLPTLGQARIGWKKITWNHYNV